MRNDFTCNYNLPKFKELCCDSVQALRMHIILIMSYTHLNAKEIMFHAQM